MKSRKDKQSAARHEAGHLIVARHFGVVASAELCYHGSARTVLRVWTGRVSYAGLNLSRFRTACIGWGGPIAEDIDEIEGVPDLPDWSLNLLLFDELSDTDRAAIFSHPQKWRACQTAYRIIAGSRDALQRETECLLRRPWRQDLGRRYSRRISRRLFWVRFACGAETVQERSVSRALNSPLKLPDN